MYSLRPHKKFDFVRFWKYGFRLSGALIALAIIGFVVSTVLTGAPLTLGTEFSGGTSIQINDAGDVTEDELRDAFDTAASELGLGTQISSIQTATSMSGGSGYIVKTTDTVSTNASEIMGNVESALGIDEGSVEVETIGASWGMSVIWSSIIAFFLSCLGILIVIALRYREPRMGVVALICLFHDMIVLLGIYAWAGLIFHMEITSDVIAALLAIIGYSLYDTVVVFHRISRNASPQMKCSLTTCANTSLNEVIVRTVNTSVTSIIPIVFMLILGTDTLIDFAFAMFCGMVVGVYSTLAISAPIYTKWKAKDPAYARLEKKYPYEVVQSPFTKQMMLEARDEFAQRRKVEKEELKRVREEERKAAEQLKSEAKAARADAKDDKAARSEVKREEKDELQSLELEEHEAERELADEASRPVDLSEDSASDIVVEFEDVEVPAGQTLEEATEASEAEADEPVGEPEVEPETQLETESELEPEQVEETVPAPDDAEVAEPPVESSESASGQAHEHSNGRYSAAKRDDESQTTTTTTSFSFNFVSGDGNAKDRDDSEKS